MHDIKYTNGFASRFREVKSDIDEEVKKECTEEDIAEISLESSGDDESTETKPAKKQRLLQTQSTQKRILDLFFNPRQKKQSYVSSWLDSCHFEEAQNIDEWNSAVLMPRLVFL